MKKKKTAHTREEIVAVLRSIADNLHAAEGIFSDPALNAAAARAAERYEERIRKLRK